MYFTNTFNTLIQDEAAETDENGKIVKTLQDSYGADFEAMYTRLEAEGKGKKTVKAQVLWYKILESQMETGTPYMCYKDAANIKSNQKNIGTIRCSNLCTEIFEFTSPDEVAVCNLASLALPMYVEKKEDGTWCLITVIHKRNRNKNNSSKVINFIRKK